MATSITTGSLNNLYTTLLVRKAVPRLVAGVALYEFAKKEPLPAGGGVTVRWNAWINFLPCSTTLSEGAANTLSSISSRKVEATIAQYGRGIQESDLIVSQSTLPMIQDIVDNLTDSARTSVDKVIQLGIFKKDGLAYNTDANILSNWCSSRYSAFYGLALAAEESASIATWQFPVVLGSSATKLSLFANTSVSGVASMYAIRKAVKALKLQNAIPFADGKFKLVASSSFLYDLKKDVSFQAWYSNAGKTEVSEKGLISHGVIEECTLYESNNLPKHRETTSADLSFVFGQNAYGCTSIGPASGYEIIIKEPNSYDTSNPFNQWTTIAYKISMAAAALNPSAGRILITKVRA